MKRNNVSNEMKFGEYSREISDESQSRKQIY